MNEKKQIEMLLKTVKELESENKELQSQNTLLKAQNRMKEAQVITYKKRYRRIAALAGV